MTDTSARPLVLAVPSKGRLMEQTAERFAAAGLTLAKTGNERGYQGEIRGLSDVEVLFVSSSEIVRLLRDGDVHLGVTGEDVVREGVADADTRLEFLSPLGFGYADVVVAVPEFWLDVTTMADLEQAAARFRREHGRRMLVATKYMNLTRRFFAASGVTDYRIIESLGATEGAPAAGAAELIVDITTTGSTLKANALRVLADGTMLRSQANLIAARARPLSAVAAAARAAIVSRLAATG
jgi:ATP phosphoribosyltransferase